MDLLLLSGVLTTAALVLPPDLCASGSEASRQEVATAIGDAVAFASETVQTTDDFSNGLAGGSGAPEPDDREINERGGGGAGSGLLILLVLSALQRRHPRARAELDVYRTSHALISADISSRTPQLEK